MRCNGAVAVTGTQANNTLVVKFNRQDLAGVKPGDQVTLTVTGRLADGTCFRGTNVIRVTVPGGKNK